MTHLHARACHATVRHSTAGEATALTAAPAVAASAAAGAAAVKARARRPPGTFAALFGAHAGPAEVPAPHDMQCADIQLPADRRASGAGFWTHPAAADACVHLAAVPLRPWEQFVTRRAPHVGWQLTEAAVSSWEEPCHDIRMRAKNPARHRVPVAAAAFGAPGRRTLTSAVPAGRALALLLSIDKAGAARNAVRSASSECLDAYHEAASLLAIDGLVSKLAARLRVADAGGSATSSACTHAHVCACVCAFVRACCACMRTCARAHTQTHERSSRMGRNRCLRQSTHLQDASERVRVLSLKCRTSFPLSLFHSFHAHPTARARRYHARTWREPYVPRAEANAQHMRVACGWCNPYTSARASCALYDRRMATGPQQQRAAHGDAGTRPADGTTRD